MIDKKNSDDEFSDEGFDEEFSFDDEEAPDLEISQTPKKTFSLSPVMKKVLIHSSLIAVLIISVYSVYRYWTAIKSSPLVTKTATPIVPIKPSTSVAEVKPSTKTKPSTPVVIPVTPVPTPTTPTTTQTPAEGFNESELAAVKKEGEKEGDKTTTQLTEATPATVVTPETKAVQSPETKIAVKSETTPVASATPATSGASPSTTGERSTTTTPQTIHPSDSNVATVVITPNHAPLVVPSITPASPAIISQMAKTPHALPPAPATSQNPPVSSVSSAEVLEMTQQINKTLEALSKLNHQMEGNLNQIKYLDSYTREVSLNVEKLNAQVTTIDNRIQGLSNLANALSKDLGKVRNEVGYAKRVAGSGEEKENLDLLTPPPRRRSADYPVIMDEGGDCSGGYAAPRQRGGRVAVAAGPEEPEFVVHAVIPGRAWLKSCKGQIITVIEGETVGNYGKVLVIDAANSVVLTSSGVAFR